MNVTKQKLFESDFLVDSIKFLKYSVIFTASFAKDLFKKQQPAAKLVGPITGTYFRMSFRKHFWLSCNFNKAETKKKPPKWRSPAFRHPSVGMGHCLALSTRGPHHLPSLLMIVGTVALRGPLKTVLKMPVSLSQSKVVVVVVAGGTKRRSEKVNTRLDMHRVANHTLIVCHGIAKHVLPPSYCTSCRTHKH